MNSFLWVGMRKCFRGSDLRTMGGRFCGAVSVLQSGEKTVIFVRKSVIFRCFPAGIGGRTSAEWPALLGVGGCFEGDGHGWGCKRA